MREKSGEYLYLIWKDPRSRRNYTVGKLSRGDSYVFEYFGEYEEAKRVGWELLAAFPEDKRYESPSLFAAFASRLPDPKRKDIDSILRKYGLASFDGYELLRRTTGRLPIDTYEFIDPILPEERVAEREFEVVGIRHNAACRGSDCDRLPTIGLGDGLVLHREPDNGHDEYAVAVCTKQGEMLGYIPRYFSESISDRLMRGTTYDCTVVRIDREHGCGGCLKVRLVMPKSKRKVDSSAVRS